MQRLRLKAFLDTLDEDVLDGINSFIADMSDSLFDEGVKRYVENRDFDYQVHQYERFYRRNVSKIEDLKIAYWSMYIKMTGKALFPTS